MTPDQMRDMEWTKPRLVIRIQFVEWTAENRLRHAKFLGVDFRDALRSFTLTAARFLYGMWTARCVPLESSPCARSMLGPCADEAVTIP